MLRKLALAVVVTLTTNLAGSVAAQSYPPDCIRNPQNDYPPLCIRQPFEDEEALKKLSSEYGLSDETVNSLREVLEYRYDFTRVLDCPYTSSDDCQAISYVAVSRTIKFPLDALPTTVIEKVLSKEKRACSSVTFPNSGLLSLQRTRLTFGGEIQAREFLCDNILGKHKTGEASGWWRITIDFIEKAAPRILLATDGSSGIDVGSVKFSEPNFTQDITDKKLLGGLIDIDTAIGGVINDVFFEFDLSPIKLTLKIFGEGTPEEKLADLIDAFERVQDLLKDFKLGLEDPIGEFYEAELLNPAGIYLFFADVGKSGFAQVDSDPISKMQLHVGQVAFFPEFVEGDEFNFFLPYHGFFERQMRTLDSRDEEDKIVVIQAGDTLYAIAERELLDPELHYILSSYNEGLGDGSRLNVGDEIKVPPFWKILVMNKRDLLIKPGETYWSKYQNSGSNENWEKWLELASGGSATPDLVYPGIVVRGDIP